MDAASIKIGDARVDPAAAYRVATNSFLATGGDGFSVFNQGTDQVGGAVDIDALEACSRPTRRCPRARRTR